MADRPAQQAHGSANRAGRDRLPVPVGQDKPVEVQREDVLRLRY